MLTPLAITRGLVVDAGEELEFLQRYLLRLDSQLVVQFPLRRALHPQDSRIQLSTSLTRNSKRVGAASVGPHIGEGDLLGGALLQQETVVGVEQEDRECTVEETLVDVGHQVA